MSKQISDQENIDNFILMIINIDKISMNRGWILDRLNSEEHKELWKYAIKALIVSSDEFLIDKQYLLRKLEYCRENLKTPHAFLDVFRLNIFTELCRDVNIFF